jgi:hypothetical protein
MKRLLSIIIIVIFVCLTFASSETSDNLSSDEAKCDVCKKIYKKADGWDYDINLWCATYVKRPGGIFCSRFCTQGRAMNNGKTNCGEDRDESQNQTTENQNYSEDRNCDECGQIFLQKNGWACKVETTCYEPTQIAPTKYLKYCSKSCSTARGSKLRGQQCE